MKKALAVLLTLCMMFAIGQMAFADGVEISLLNSKPEITEALEAAAAEYEAATGVKITVYETSAPGDFLTEAYAAGDPTTLAIIDYANVRDFCGDYFLDLSNEDWAAVGGSSIGASFNGALYGFPFAVEARGVCYNKTAIEAALGSEFDPANYATREAFEGLLAQLREAGMENAIVLNAEDWSIGSHYLQTMYSLYDGTMAGGYKFTEDLTAGGDIAQAACFNEACDTLDLFMEYNYNKEDPLAAAYDMNACNCAEGTVAFWLNGTFAWPDFSEFAIEGNEYGVMSIPVSADCAGCGKVSAASTKFVSVDKAYATEEQQKAALDFLNWLVFTEEGNDLLVNKCGVVPAFSNIKLEMSNPFNTSLMSYISADNTICVFNDLPSDHRSALGADMQKYIAGELDRAGLAADLNTYWQSK